MANVLAHLILSGSWHNSKRQTPLVLCEPLVFLTDSILLIGVGGLLSLYSVSISAMYLGPRPLSDL